MSEPGFTETSQQERQLHADQRRRPLWPFALLAAVLAAVVVWRVTQMGDDAPGRVGIPEAVGAKVTELALEPLTGDPPPVRATNLDGKVTLINFWGTWCGPCAMEFPHLIELVRHFREQGDFQFFSVSSNYDPRDETGLAENTALFLKQQRADFPTHRDPDANSFVALARAAGIQHFGFPTTVVLDRDARIRGMWIGYAPGDERQVRRVVEETLRGDPLPVPKGGDSAP